MKFTARHLLARDPQFMLTIVRTYRYVFIIKRGPTSNLIPHQLHASAIVNTVHSRLESRSTVLTDEPYELAGFKNLLNLVKFFNKKSDPFPRIA